MSREKKCGECALWERMQLAEDKPYLVKWGFCRWVRPEGMILPQSMPRQPTSMLEEWGKECPCWQEQPKPAQEST